MKSFLNSQDLVNAIVIKTVWYQCKKRQTDECNQVENPGLSSHIYGRSIHDIPVNTEKWGKMIFSVGGTGSIRYNMGALISYTIIPAVL